METKTLQKPTIWDELFPGRFLHADELRGRDVTVTIAAVDMELLPDDKGKEQARGVLSIKERPKQLGLCKTVGICLKAMFGNKPQEWVGKRVTIFPTTTKFGGDTVPAIRVRGSPDISEDLDVEIKLPRKKPQTVRLIKTATATATQPATEAK